MSIFWDEEMIFDNTKKKKKKKETKKQNNVIFNIHLLLFHGIHHQRRPFEI